MSYDIELVDTECNVCEVGRHWEGGSHLYTGSTCADEITDGIPYVGD